MEPPQAPGIDPSLRAYVQRVHRGLYLKHLELHALEKRHEPKMPKVGLKTRRPRADARQKAHILRRYDESLCYLTGFTYNPKWAHFDRDAYGTGRLQFEAGVSLLGTDRSQDRWLEQQEPSAVVPASSKVHRGARIDAFFSMFARRQEMTLLAGSAPLCVFVGQRFPTPVRLPGLRTPPRPESARIPLHRYPRLCMSVIHDDDRHGTIYAVVVMERQPSAWANMPVGYSAHVLASGEAVTRDPNDKTEWGEYLSISVANSWHELFQGRGEAYQIFESSRMNPLETVSTIACPGGDAQMLFRAGLLLESPNLAYRPWLRGAPVGSLDRLLLEGSVKEGKSLTVDAWIKYTLMTRIYPYVLLAQQDMTENAGYQPYTKDVPLDRQAVQAFQRTVVPDMDTDWRAKIQKRSKQKRRQKRRQKQEQKQQQAKEGAKSSESRFLPVGVNGGERRGLAGLVRRRGGRGRTPRTAAPGRARGDITISRPTLRTEQTREIRALVRASNTVSTRAEAEEARFLAVRMAFEAVSRNDPLYVTSSEIWNEQEAYTVAKQWRQAILYTQRSEELLWTLGVNTLTLLYDIDAIWGAGEQTELASFARARWAQRLERRAPKGMSQEYLVLAKKPLQVKPFVPPASWQAQKRRGANREALKARDAALRQQSLQEITGNPSGSPPLLLRVARGTTPPDRGTNHADLQIMALAVAVSLIRDGLLFLAPPRGPDRQGRLERSFAERLPLLWNQEGDQMVGGERPGTVAIPRSEATVRSLATFALLSWEWGSRRGLTRYLAWIDDTAARLGHPATSRPSHRLIGQYPLFAELLGAAPPILGASEEEEEESEAEEEESEAEEEESEAEEEKAKQLADEQNTQLSNLLRYVELMHGYQQGELARMFQGAADRYAQGLALSPAQAKAAQTVRPVLTGIGQPAAGVGASTNLFAGWEADNVVRVNLDNLQLRYRTASATQSGSRALVKKKIRPAAPGSSAREVPRAFDEPKRADDLWMWLRAG